jgi:molecular chaperone Hsp33
MSHYDRLQRFMLEHTRVRGQFVRLSGAWRAVIAKRDYPRPVQALLGEAITATVLMGAMLKFKGSISLQVQSEGPVSLLLAQVSSERTLRGLAMWKDPITDERPSAMLQKGRILISIDPEFGKKRYQSIVSLQGDSLAEALDRYFEQSEQLQTRLWLTANGHHAAGLMLQEMPLPAQTRDTDPDAWNRAVILASTLNRQELLQRPALNLLRRLYHEEDVRVFKPESISFGCGCSRGRIEAALRGLGHGEMQATLAEQGKVEVNCEFCNQQYNFDAVDIGLLFAATHSPVVQDTRH